MKVGDILLKSGSFVKPNDITPKQKENAVGVVAYLFPDGRVNQSLKAKLGREPQGLVLALKNAANNNPVQWADDGIATLGKDFQKGSLSEDYASNQDGFILTEEAKRLLSSNSHLTAFQTAINFNQCVAAPAATTDWYLPSIGDWIDMLSDTGLGKIAKDSIDCVKNHTSGKKRLYVQDEVVATLNAALNKVGGNYVDLFSTTTGSTNEKRKIVGDCFWTSSEKYLKNTPDQCAFSLHFSDQDLSFHYHTKTESIHYKVRCVLAF
ncbi:hypothetical protein EVA_09415 [gut metagenome]|uniref:Uncharacterized protein n=1 Tax=gut metagenome TaxID=749906 RepID=J9GQX6_9ZZZZ